MSGYDAIKPGWDAYIDNMLAYCRDASGDWHCDRACIIGLDGGGKWTSDTHPSALKLSANEAVTIASCFKSRNFSTFQESGVVAEGEKYVFIREEDGKLVYSKRKGSGWLMLRATRTAVVIAHCPEEKLRGYIYKGTGVIADYLDSQNM